MLIQTSGVAEGSRFGAMDWAGCNLDLQSVTLGDFPRQIRRYSPDEQPGPEEKFMLGNARNAGIIDYRQKGPWISPMQSGQHHEPRDSSFHNLRALDLVDRLAALKSIGEREIQTFLGLPKFAAAVIAYRSGIIPLGYAAFFGWPDASSALPGLTPERLADLIHYAAWRTRLDVSDKRHIAIDFDRMRDAFPRLFRSPDYMRKKEHHDDFVREMEDFLASDPRVKNYFVPSDARDEREYAAYWLKSSSERVRPLLTDRRFLAALDAFHEGALSYGGLLERLYGDIDYVLFPEIGRHLSGLVVVQMAMAIDRREITIPTGLRVEYPNLYEPYNPEAFGHDKEHRGHAIHDHQGKIGADNAGCAGR